MLTADTTTLFVIIETDQHFHEDMAATLERGEPHSGTNTTSINAVARAVECDVKNVYEQLTHLESLGVIYSAEEGQSKRSVVCGSMIS